MTPTLTVTVTSSPTATSAVTSTATATNTVPPGNTATATATNTVPAGNTATATRTVPPGSTATATRTVPPGSTATATRTVPPGSTATRTATPAGTVTATPTACVMPFTDVPVEYYAYGYIKWAYCHGIASGYADNTFRPEYPITRGQIAKMIVLAAGWDLTLPPGAPHFIDVPPGSIYYTYVEVAYAHGIISGYFDHTYLPFLPVTRAQLTKMLVLAKGYTLLNPPTPTFTDVPPSYWAYTFIETAAAHNIVGGYSDGTFRPLNLATRAQFCKMLFQAYAVPSALVGKP